MMSDRFPLDRETRFYNQLRLKEEAAIGIYNLMEEAEVNRAELARIIGKSRSYVTKVLEGSHNFTLETLADVYAALGRAVHLSLADDVREFRVPSDDWKVTTLARPTIYQTHADFERHTLITFRSRVSWDIRSDSLLETGSRLEMSGAS